MLYSYFDGICDSLLYCVSKYLYKQFVAFIHKIKLDILFESLAGKRNNNFPECFKELTSKICDCQ